ncbi:MAG: hypothetical protein LBH82_02385, partial [Bacteroidales bacterium]|nr:hypothetical protein [Bacteroidales bacterium]
MTKRKSVITAQAKPQAVLQKRNSLWFFKIFSRLLNSRSHNFWGRFGAIFCNISPLPAKYFFQKMNFVLFSCLLLQKTNIVMKKRGILFLTVLFSAVSSIAQTENIGARGSGMGN